MQIYFYCSYAHSSRGFFMTCLDGTQLKAQDESQLPEQVSDFFSYARYRFLWREYGTFVQLPTEPACEIWPEQPARSVPVRDGAFLGLRELHGTFADGRSAAANLVILGDETEITALRRTALSILGDYDAFEKRLIGYLSVGGPCGYELDGGAFLSWLRECAGKNVLHRVTESGSGAGRMLQHLVKEPEDETQLIRLAVCSYDWERMRGFFGSGPMWQGKPRGVLSVSEFQEAFRGHGVLWTMDEEPDKPDQT